MFKLQVDRAISKNTIDLYLTESRGESYAAVALPQEIVWKSFPPMNAERIDPWLSLRPDIAIPLIKAIVEGLEADQWVRTKVTESSKESEALKENLKDLRSITDKLINIVSSQVNK